MSSAANSKYQQSIIGTRILSSFYGTTSPACADQQNINQECLKAAIAHIVGCWEGYVEAVIQEFVAKTRIQANARAWPLIVQFEAMVQNAAKELNTPNWDRTRNLLILISGVDPYASWIWAPKFTNQQDTKEFFDGIMNVRHAFAHGFTVPSNIKGLSATGSLDLNYINDTINFFAFMVDIIDQLLEHELHHKHNCRSGWN